MAFFLTLVYLVLLYVRPLDLIPSMQGVPVMLYLGVFNVVLTIAAWTFASARKRAPLLTPQVKMTFLFVALAIFSWLRIGWWVVAREALFDLQPMLGVFVMVVVNVNTMKRLRWFVITLVAATLYMCAQGMYSYYTGWEHASFVLDQGQLDAEGEFIGDVLPRMRHLGVFSDPNDFAQALLVVMPLAAIAWKPKGYIFNLAGVIPIFLFCFWGIYLTHSRGALIALALLCLLAMREKMSKIKAAILTGILLGVFLVFNLSAGRAVRDSSSEARIEAWASGIFMLRANPLLGVGYNNYVEHHPGLTAHNSFVLCFSEMGLLGYFVWMSLLVLTYMELTRLMKLPGNDPRLIAIQRWARCIRLSLSVFLAASYFLSRTYVVTLYLLIAMCLCLTAIARGQGFGIEVVKPKEWSKETLKWEFVSIFMVWLSVKLNGAG